MMRQMMHGVWANQRALQRDPLKALTREVLITPLSLPSCCPHHGLVSLFMLFMRPCVSRALTASVCHSLPAPTALARRILLKKMVSTAAYSKEGRGDSSAVHPHAGAEPTSCAASSVAAAAICPSPKRPRSSIDFDALPLPHFQACSAVPQPAVKGQSPRSHLDLALKSVVKVYTTTAA